MTMSAALRSALVIAGASAVLLIGLPQLFLPWYVHLGATADERHMALPGDSIVAHPTTGYTLAITIETPAESVWPWIAQMGQGRGGFYTHTWIENLLGADIQNADSVNSSLQNLAAGDTVRLTPNPYLGRPGQFMLVAEFKRPHALVFEQRLPSGGTASWALILLEDDDGTTRLITRRRGSRPSLFDRVMEPGYVLMDRGVLRGIRERATGDHGVRCDLDGCHTIEDPVPPEDTPRGLSPTSGAVDAS
jgi:hypothetical protein